MSANVYLSADELLFRGKLDLEGDALTVMLLGETYTLDLVNHSKLIHVVEHESTGPGYERQRLTGQRIARDDAGKSVALFADDVEWPEATVSAKYVVIVRGDDLVGVADFGVVKSSGDAPFSVHWHASGVMRLKGK